jgi:hypothetical protein
MSKYLPHEKQQIPPLRFAPVGMTILFKEFSVRDTGLSKG